MNNKTPFHRCIVCLVAAAGSLAIGETPDPVDSIVPAPMVENQATPSPLAPATAITASDSKGSIPSVAPAPVAPSAPTTQTPKDKHIILLFDLSDVNAQYRTGQRHFHKNATQTNYCCLDISWSPVSLWKDRLRFGPLVDFGGWTQTMSAGPATTLNDLMAGVNFSTPIPTTKSGPWARVDLGLSTLAVTRRTTGIDFGMAAAARAGWNFAIDGYSLILGMGTDTRQYLSLDMKPITAATIFAGFGI